MIRIQYQLLKDNEPIAVGSMAHCLDVFYWEIYYGYDHLLYNIVPFKQDEEVYRKAKAFDKLVELYPQKDEIPSDEFFMMMGYIIKESADEER